MTVYQCVRCTQRSAVAVRRCSGCGGRTFSRLELVEVDRFEYPPAHPSELVNEPAPPFGDESREPGSSPNGGAGSLAELGLPPPGELTHEEWPVTDGAEPCGQEGGIVGRTPDEHVRGVCAFDRGHDGPHSWELEASARADAHELGGAECDQAECTAAATHRFTWPGHPEQYCCAEHGAKALQLAEAMGFELQVLEL